MTVSNTLDGQLGSRPGIHANGIYWLLGLIYAVFPFPQTLLLLSTLACAGAGLGVYAFARRRLDGSPWALLPAVAFWLSPIVHDANIYDFHVITITTCPVVWTLWAFTPVA